MGLASVRGTATSGHVQGNRSYVRPSRARHRIQENLNQGQQHQRNRNDNQSRNHRKAAKANQEIILHEHKRQFEITLMKLRDQLEEDDRMTDAEIENRITKERKEQEMRWKAQEEYEMKRKIQQQQQQEQKMLEQKEEEAKDTEGKDPPLLLGQNTANDAEANNENKKEGQLVIASKEAKIDDDNNNDSRNRNSHHSNDRGRYSRDRDRNYDDRSYHRRYDDERDRHHHSRHSRWERNDRHGRWQSRDSYHRRGGYNQRHHNSRTKAETNDHLEAVNKEDQNRNMRMALGIRDDKYVEGKCNKYYLITT